MTSPGIIKTDLHDHIEPVVEVVRVDAIWSREGSHCELGGQLLGNGLEEDIDGDIR